jgi:hypothetical protein
MQRRSFLRVSATALGCGPQLAPIAAKALQPLNLVRGRKMFEAINAVPCRLSTQASCVTSCIQTTYLSWATTAYKPALEDAIWMAGNFALLPLLLQHPHYGVLDTLLFCQKEIDTWVSSGTLSGFQIEAIEKALEAPDFAALSPDTCQSLFLPVPKRGLYHAVGWAYATRSGFFQVQTHLVPPFNQVQATVFKGDLAIWQEQFQSSQHIPRQPRQPYIGLNRFLYVNISQMATPTLPTC